MSDRFVIDIPADFKAHPAVYSVVHVKAGDRRAPRYAVRFPEDAVPALMLEALGPHVHDLLKARHDEEVAGFASSNYQPFIMIGEHSHEEQRDWFMLRAECEGWQIPLDTLLWKRPLQIAVNVFNVNIPNKGPGRGIGLLGVKVLGDLSRSEDLERLIGERRALFEGTPA